MDSPKITKYRSPKTRRHRSIPIILSSSPSSHNAVTDAVKQIRNIGVRGKKQIPMVKLTINTGSPMKQENFSKIRHPTKSAHPCSSPVVPAHRSSSAMGHHLKAQLLNDKSKSQSSKIVPQSIARPASYSPRINPSRYISDPDKRPYVIGQNIPHHGNYSPVVSIKQISPQYQPPPLSLQKMVPIPLSKQKKKTVNKNEPALPRDEPTQQKSDGPETPGLDIQSLAITPKTDIQSNENGSHIPQTINNGTANNDASLLSINCSTSGIHQDIREDSGEYVCAVCGVCISPVFNHEDETRKYDQTGHDTHNVQKLLRANPAPEPTYTTIAAYAVMRGNAPPTVPSGLLQRSFSVSRINTGNKKTDANSKYQNTLDDILSEIMNVNAKINLPDSIILNTKHNAQKLMNNLALAAEEQKDKRKFELTTKPRRTAGALICHTLRHQSEPKSGLSLNQQIGLSWKHHNPKSDTQATDKTFIELNKTITRVLM